MVTVWSKRARVELQKAFEFIAIESPQNALKVTNTIVDLSLELPKHPSKHPLDKYKVNNDDSWRAFEKYHYRISYRITSKEIRIVRLRHTSRSPLSY